MKLKIISTYLNPSQYGVQLLSSVQNMAAFDRLDLFIRDLLLSPVVKALSNPKNVPVLWMPLKLEHNGQNLVLLLIFLDYRFKIELDLLVSSQLGVLYR